MAARGFDVDPFLHSSPREGGSRARPGPGRANRERAVGLLRISRLTYGRDSIPARMHSSFAAPCSTASTAPRDRSRGRGWARDRRCAQVGRGCGCRVERARELRLHPRIGEILLAELETTPTVERAAAWTIAATMYEGEGETHARSRRAHRGRRSRRGAAAPAGGDHEDVVGRLDVEETARLLAGGPVRSGVTRGDVCKLCPRGR